MAYITVSNANRIIKKSELLSTDFKGEVYKLPIRFFSKYEANSLLAIQEFLKNPEHYFNEYYAPLRVSDSYNFIYEGHKPAYHDSLDCPRIYADYENFEIPKSIRKQGGESIFKFRAWFKNNDHLLSTKADLFYQKLKFSWGITERINQVKVANSGVTKKENYVLEELETKIDVLIKEAGRYYYACDKNTTILRRFSKCTFLAYRNSKIDKNDTGFSDIEVKSFLKDYDHRFKKPLKTLLHEYYRIKLNPDIQLEGSLLEQLNFKPCSHCNGSYGKSWNIKNTVLVDVL